MGMKKYLHIFTYSHFHIFFEIQNADSSQSKYRTYAINLIVVVPMMYEVVIW